MDLLNYYYHLNFFNKKFKNFILLKKKNNFIYLFFSNKLNIYNNLLFSFDKFKLYCKIMNLKYFINYDSLTKDKYYFSKFSFANKEIFKNLLKNNLNIIFYENKLKFNIIFYNKYLYNNFNFFDKGINIKKIIL